MKDRSDLDTRTINRDLLRFPLHWPLWFFGAAGLFVLDRRAVSRTTSWPQAAAT